MFKQYKNHVISNTVYKPRLYKKGKLWLVSGITLLSLLGIGGFKSANTHAMTINNPNNQINNNINNKQSVKPTNISTQANQVHHALLNQNAMYWHNNTDQPRSNQQNLGLNLTATDFDFGKKASSTSSSNSTNASLKAYQESFANNVNNHGMQDTKISSASSISNKAINSSTNTTSSSSTSVNSKKFSNQSSLSSSSATHINDYISSKNMSSSPSSMATPKFIPSNANFSNKQGNKASQGIELSTLYTHDNFKSPAPAQVVNDKILFINQPTQLMINHKLVIRGINGNQYTLQDNQIPRGYKLVNPSNQTFTISKGNHKIYITPAPKTNHHVHVLSGTVNFKGTIRLHYGDGNNTIKNIDLPYNVKTKNNQVIGDLLNNTNPSAMIPTDYLNKVINQFNTANFTYSNNVNNNKYQNIAVDPHAYGWFNQDSNNPVFVNGMITLNFTPNNVKENIHYQYQHQNEGNTVFNGKNDEQGIDNNGQGLNPDYHIDPNNPHNTWIYGNGGSDASGKYNDSDIVNVLPNTAKTTVNYINSDNQIIGSSSINGNYGDALPAINHNNIPSGYYFVRDANNNPTKFNNQPYNMIISNHGKVNYYDNQGHIISSTDTILQSDGKPNSYKFSNDITNPTNSNIPSGYHITYNRQNGNIDNIGIAPNALNGTLVVNYQTDGHTTKTLNSDLDLNLSNGKYTLPTSIISKYIKDGYTMPSGNIQLTDNDIKNGNTTITLNLNTESAGTMEIHYYDVDLGRVVSTFDYTKQDIENLCPYINRYGGLHWNDGEEVELAPYVDRNFGFPTDLITGRQILYVLGSPGKPVPVGTHLIHTVNPITLLHKSSASNIFHPVGHGLAAFVTFK